MQLLKPLIKGKESKKFVLQDSHTNPKSDLSIHTQISEQTQSNANVSTRNIKADLHILQSTHPEIFHKPSQVFKILREIKDNPTHFYQTQDKDKMSIVGKNLKNGDFGEIGIVKDGYNAGKVGHILKSNPANKRAHKLNNRESGAVVGSDKTPHTDLRNNRSDGRAGNIKSLSPRHEQHYNTDSTKQTQSNLPMERE